MTMRLPQSVNKKLMICLVGSFLGVIAMGYRSDLATMAMVFKTIQDVTKKSGSSEWLKAAKGENLISGDQIKTGKQSLAVVKFLDNSIFRVREQSLLVISGEGSRGSEVKSIELDSGALGFSVQKQKQNDLFRLTSPTSVASIRGTKGKWSGGGGNDTLVVVEGLVNLLNNFSKNNVDVPAGFIGFSRSDGFVSSRQATGQELADADNAATSNSLNELNLELKDSKGNKKELKLKFNR